MVCSYTELFIKNIRYFFHYLGIKKPALMLRAFLYLALQPGLEPGTCGLTVRRSTD